MPEKHLEAHHTATPDEHAANAKNALQQAAMIYRVCKDGTVVFPPDVCPQTGKQVLDFNTKM